MSKKIINALSILIILILFLLTTLSFVPKILGFNAYYANSFSMEKAIPYGALVLTKHIDFGDIKSGDILTFEKDDRTDYFTHRVVSINKEEKTFITKGDNNNTIDPTDTPYKNVVGKVYHIIPFAGFISMFLHTRLAKVMIALLLIIYIAIEIEIYKTKKGRNEYEKENN